MQTPDTNLVKLCHSSILLARLSPAPCNPNFFCCFLMSTSCICHTDAAYHFYNGHMASKTSILNNNKRDFYRAHLLHKVGAQGTLQ